MLPLTIDYGVAMNGRPGPDAGATVAYRKGPDWFWAMRRDARGVQDAFISLPDEIVVAGWPTCPPQTLKGVKNIEILAGVEKPHKTCTIYYRGGQATYRYRQKAWERSDKASRPGRAGHMGQPGRQHGLRRAESHGRSVQHSLAEAPASATFSACITSRNPSTNSAL